MTRTNIALCILVAGVITGSSFAISRARSATVTPAAATAEAKAEVKQVIDEFFEAARQQNWDRAGDTFAPDFEIYTDGASGYNKAAYIKVLKEENIETRRMELSGLEIHASPDGQVAWCKYRGDFDSAAHGKASHVKTAETLIFEKRSGRWKIVRAHASVQDLGSGS